MATNDAQVWNGRRFTITRDDSAAPATVRFHLSGPFTARDMYSTISPADFRARLLPKATETESTAHIFDLTEVPYIDSMGLGMLISHYAHCQRNGISLVVIGAGPRVLELFRTTKVDRILLPPAV